MVRRMPRLLWTFWSRPADCHWSVLLIPWSEDCETHICKTGHPPHADKISSPFGIPDVPKRDNGPPVRGVGFVPIANSAGFRHRKITPVCSKANRSRKFHDKHKQNDKSLNSWRKNKTGNVHIVVQSWTARCHGLCSAAVIFKQYICSQSPEHSSPTRNGSDFRDTDGRRKLKMKLCARGKHSAKESVIRPGDLIFLKQKQEGKFFCCLDRFNRKSCL